MRIILQRVLEASVSVGGKEISRIGRGLLVLLGITDKDDNKLAEKMAKKLLRIRVWDEIMNKKPLNQAGESKSEEEEIKTSSEANNDNGKNNENKEPRSWHSCVIDNDYEVLVVSQFTLYGILKGNKPDFHKAMNADEARKMYEFFLTVLKKDYKEEKIQGGMFQEYMHVGLVNDGPVTLVYEEENEEENNNNSKKKK